MICMSLFHSVTPLLPFSSTLLSCVAFVASGWRETFKDSLLGKCGPDRRGRAKDTGGLHNGNRRIVCCAALTLLCTTSQSFFFISFYPFPFWPRFFFSDVTPVSLPTHDTRVILTLWRAPLDNWYGINEKMFSCLKVLKIWGIWKKNNSWLDLGSRVYFHRFNSWFIH